MGFYVATLQEVLGAESILANDLPRVAELATRPTLKAHILSYRDGAALRLERLEAILAAHKAEPLPHMDQIVEAMVSKMEKMLAPLDSDALGDVGLVGALQKVQHHQMAAYGTVAALAAQQGLDDDAAALHRSLDEEKEADLALTDLALTEINRAALAA